MWGGVVADTLAVGGCVLVADKEDSIFLNNITTLKPILQIGEISSTFFLIHYPVLGICGIITAAIAGGGPGAQLGCGVVAFMLTYLLCLVWGTLIRKYMVMNEKNT